MSATAPWLTPEQRDLTVQLLRSHQRAFGQALLAAAQVNTTHRQTCQELFACGFPVLAHGSGDDPRLIYANAAALLLWETRWNQLIGMPSRLTAPVTEQAERRHALGQAENLEAIAGYRGIRISRHGRRFMISNARVWTLRNRNGQAFGQAASFSDWWWL